MARKFTYDESKVRELRMMLISAAIEVMKDNKSVESWSAYKKEMVLKMSPRVLPTLTEVTGKDGGAIEISGVDVLVRK